jgi:hypothetical protein
VLAAIYLTFLTGLLLHGLIIWDAPVERAGALLAAAGMVVLPVVFWRGGASARRLTVELRDDQRDGRAGFRMVLAGEPAAGTVDLGYDSGERRAPSVVGDVPDLPSLRRAVFRPSSDSSAQPREVKVWAHRITPEGVSEALPAQVRVRSGDDVRAADVALSRGEALFPAQGADLEVEVVVKGPEEPGDVDPRRRA